MLTPRRNETQSLCSRFSLPVLQSIGAPLLRDGRVAFIDL
jgi:hypothetical protein